MRSLTCHCTQMKDLSQSLRAIRQSLDLSQEQLAAKLGVSLATINRWEAGKSKPQRAQQDVIDKLFEEIVADAPPPDELPLVTKRRGMSQNSVLSTKPMEQMLWNAACSIRGEKDAPKFKDYLLPLLFLKRLSDVFAMSLGDVDELLRRSAEIGFVDVEQEGADRLLFNGNLFRRNSVVKSKHVLDSLSASERDRLTAR